MMFRLLWAHRWGHSALLGFEPLRPALLAKTYRPPATFLQPFLLCVP